MGESKQEIQLLKEQSRENLKDWVGTEQEHAETQEYVRKRIKKARMEKGISARALSTLIGRTPSYISSLETGRIETKIADLLAIAQATQQPIKYFMPNRYKQKEQELDGEEYELVKNFRKIKTEDAKEIAQKTVKQLAGLKH